MRKLLILLGITGVLMALAAWLGLPVYRQWKERRFLRQAHSFMEASRYPAAWISGHQALILNHTNLETLELLATLAEKGRSPQAISLRKRIVDLTPQSLTNRLAWAQAALEMEPFPFEQATKALESVEDAGRRTVPYHFAAAALALKRGQLPGAEQHFEEAIKLESTNALAQLNLAVMCLRTTNANARAAAQVVLAGLRNQKECRLPALRSLVSSHWEAKEYTKALVFSRELLSEKEVELSDRLRHGEILLAGGSKEVESHLLNLKQAAASKPGDIYELAAWLRANGRADEALAWLQSLPKTMRGEFPVPAAIADVYVGKADWRKLEKFLRDEAWGDQDHVRFALLAYSLQRQGDKETSQIQWGRAVRFSGERLDMLTTLSRMAAGWGWEKEAEAMLLAIAENHPTETWALQALHQFYMPKGNTAGLEKVFEAAVRADANDFIAKNNLAVVSLLLEHNVFKAHELARDVYQKDPKNPGFASTYAFSLHLQGKTAEALKVFQALDAKAFEDPSNAAYYGVILAAGGEKQMALKYLNIAENAAILPEEKTLIAQAKRAL